ncbi:MAG TPA: protein kinase [Thermoanaerobaculia bacterium]|nr:protein kinase [Thermoanaerobaculia bacterium]
MIGRELAQYRILEKIGEGGMGAVYLAEDERLHRRVALKVLSDAARDDKRSARFEREIRAVASINHPNVVTLHDVEEVEGCRFLVMELVEGRTLDELLGDRPQLSLRQFLDLAIPLVDGLRAAHAKGIAHRDLKPRNVMIDGEGRVKLLDFGLANWRKDHTRADGAGDFDSLAELTRTGTILGTPAYMSPEQLRGKGDRSSDLFAAGILFYEMLTGVRPFQGETPTEIASSILRDDPPAISTLRSGLPAVLDAIVARCLEKRSEDRYADADELLADLRSLHVESQLRDLTDSFEYRAWQRRRWRRWWTVAALAVLAAAVGGYLLWSKLREPRYQPAVQQVVAWQGDVREPRLAPDERWISFVSTRDGRSSVYLQQIEGGGSPARVSDPATQVQSHLWSPDGERLALLNLAGQRYFLQTIPTFGGVPIDTVPLATDAELLRLVRWYGEHVYLEAFHGLLRLDLASRELEELIVEDGGGTELSAYDVSPDQRSVLANGREAGRLVMLEMDIRGGKRRNLSLRQGDDYDPRFIGGGGDLIAFTSTRGGRSDLWVTRLRRPEAAVPIVWSSLNERIDDTSLSAPKLLYRETQLSMELFTTGAGGRGMASITTRGIGTGAVSVAADGRTLAYQESDPRSPRSWYPFGSRILTAELAGDLLREQRAAVSGGALPLISPGGRLVAFLRQTREGVELSVHDSLSQFDHQVTPRYAYAGLWMTTLEEVSARMAWESANELLFVEWSDPQRQRLARWRWSDQVGELEVVHEPGADLAIDDLRVDRQRRIAGFLTSVGSGKADFTGRPRGVRLMRLDLDTKQVRTLATLEIGTRDEALFLGWAAGDGAPLVAQAGPSAGTSQRVDLWWARDGRLERSGALERTLGAGLHLDPGRSRVLYVARSEDEDASNVFAYDLESGASTQLTFNHNPATQLSDLEVLPSGELLFSRAEETVTIILMTLERR